MIDVNEVKRQIKNMRLSVFVGDGNIYIRDMSLLYDGDTVKIGEIGTSYWVQDKDYPVCEKCRCNFIERYVHTTDYAECSQFPDYCPSCGRKMLGFREEGE